MYLVSAGRRTFRPWTHTSDDSYMYQPSLVVATATYSIFNNTMTELARKESQHFKSSAITIMSIILHIFTYPATSTVQL